MKKVAMTLQVTVVVPQGDRVSQLACQEEHDGMIVAQFVYDHHDEWDDYPVLQEVSTGLTH